MPIDNSRINIKVRVYHCDICNDKIDCNDDIEAYIDMMNDINDSYESEYDKQEPKLLLCLFCQEEFNIPSWVWLLPTLSIDRKHVEDVLIQLVLV